VSLTIPPAVLGLDAARRPASGVLRDGLYRSMPWSGVAINLGAAANSFDGTA